MDDPKAFEQLVVRHQGAVCAVAYSILRDRGRSEEVAQEAFLIAWQKLPAMSPAPELPAWVCGIARNLARNTARRFKESSMETALEPSTTTTPVDQMLDRERHELADRALAELADADRDAIVLYYRGDGSFSDVAATLGITEPAARQRVHRGRERLKSALTAVETSLRATRPSHAFTAACVAALVATGGTSSAATTTAKATKRLWIGGAIAVVAIGGGAAVAVTSNSNSSQPEIVATAPAIVVDAPARKAPLDSAYIKRIAAPERASALDKLRGAKRIGPSNGGSATELGTGAPDKIYDFSGDVLVAKPNVSPPDPATLNKSTIRYAIRDVSPLLLECYGEAFDRLPKKDGVVEVRLTLIGEVGSPTLVDKVELGGEVTDAGLTECIRETLYTIEMPAMPATETWSVNYPLTLTGTRP